MLRNGRLQVRGVPRATGRQHVLAPGCPASHQNAQARLAAFACWPLAASARRCDAAEHGVRRRSGVPAIRCVCGKMRLGLLDTLVPGSSVSLLHLHAAADDFGWCLLHDNLHRGKLFAESRLGCRWCPQPSWCLATLWKCQVGLSAAPGPLMPLLKPFLSLAV